MENIPYLDRRATERRLQRSSPTHIIIHISTQITQFCVADLRQRHHMSLPCHSHTTAALSQWQGISFQPKKKEGPKRSKDTPLQLQVLLYWNPLSNQVAPLVLGDRSRSYYLYRKTDLNLNLCAIE